MYELQHIDEKVVNKFFKTIYQVIQKDNWYEILFVSLKSTFHDMVPNAPDFGAKPYIKQLLKPMLELRNEGFLIRDFKNEQEREELFKNTYNTLIDEDKYNLDLIDYIYDLLPYDRVIEFNGKSYLYSYYYLSMYAQEHQEAYNSLQKLLANKLPEQNYDVATNSSDNKTAFLNSMFKPKIANPNIDSSTEELQQAFSKNCLTDFRITVRSVHEISKLTHFTENFEMQAIGTLKPYINADDEITKHDIYKSWYAYAFSVYKNKSMPETKKLKLSQLSSYVLFPHLKKSQPIYSIKSARKPIREIAFFQGLRLLEFTDNRTKINKTQEEIDFTQTYISIITSYLQKYI